MILGALPRSALSTAHAAEPCPFVKVGGTEFIKGDRPYYYIGANYWYGGILGSAGEGGDRARLARELDLLRDLGVDNLRILVGAEGPDGQYHRVTPALQIAPGRYNDVLFDGLDFLLAEMGRRGQVAVLYLLNSWEWSGGYAQYLNWSGYGDIPYPFLPPHTWDDFKKYAVQFHGCADCRRQFQAHVRHTLGRTNRYTGKKYTEDPAIMAWEIANEPRAFSTANIPAFEQWVTETAAFIKSLDSNHLVTTGMEGEKGSEGSLALFERIHADPNIDYLTMHIWPKNWRWIDLKDIPGSMAKATDNTNAYLDRHIEVARRLGKPIIVEEFGLPRDHQRFSLDDPTTCRDAYYENIFARVLEHAGRRDVLAGCNFWTFSGTGRPVPGHVFWQRGDACLGDPPQEEQGLNSVFDTDSTIALIRNYNARISKLPSSNRH